MSVIDEVLQDVERIASDYADWVVGTTSSPKYYREALDGPADWHSWNVGSPHVSHVIGTYLVARGMTGDSISEEDAGSFICIFRKSAQPAGAAKRHLRTTPETACTNAALSQVRQQSA